MLWENKKPHSNKYLYTLITIYTGIYLFLIYIRHYYWLTYLFLGISFLLILSFLYLSHHALQITSQILIILLKRTPLYRLLQLLKLEKFITDPATKNKIIKIYKEKVIEEIANDSLYIARDYIHKKEQNSRGIKKPTHPNPKIDQYFLPKKSPSLTVLLCRQKNQKLLS